MNDENSKRLFNQATEAKIKEIFESDVENFVELAKMNGLDPASDFRHTNMADVDFSNCDIRGFDFTGADLTGSHGVNVIWDETTIIEDSDIEGSLFEVRQ